MKRLWFLLLAASIGLNAAMLWQHFTRGQATERAAWREGVPARAATGGMRRAGPDGGPGPEGPGPGERDPGDGGPPPYELMLERRLEHMTRELDLSDAQADRLREIATAHFTELDSLRREARAERGRIRDLLGAARIDAGAVRTASGRLSDIDARIEARITENMIQEAGVLEPGQRTQYLDMMRFAGPRGRGGYRPRRR